jgi:hypothetical protein
MAKINRSNKSDLEEKDGSRYGGADLPSKGENARAYSDSRPAPTKNESGESTYGKAFDDHVDGMWKIHNERLSYK